MGFVKIRVGRSEQVIKKETANGTKECFLSKTYCVTIPQDIASQYRNTNFRVVAMGENIILQSGCSRREQ